MRGPLSLNASTHSRSRRPPALSPRRPLSYGPLPIGLRRQRRRPFSPVLVHGVAPLGASDRQGGAPRNYCSISPIRPVMTGAWLAELSPAEGGRGLRGAFGELAKSNKEASAALRAAAQ